MANQKISELSALAETPATGDLIPLVDISASETKSVTRAFLYSGVSASDHAHVSYSASDHAHVSYSASDHLHVGYSASDHAHSAYSASAHTHSNYSASDHAHTGYSASDHTHSAYSASGHTHTNYSASDHAHSAYSASEHTHSAYSASEHTHTNYAASDYAQEIIAYKVFLENQAVASGDGKGFITIPYQMNGFNIVDADAALASAATSSGFLVQLYNCRSSSDILSTRISIDASEFSSYTAATAPVIDTNADDLQTGDRIRIDVDVAQGSGLDVFIVAKKP